MAQDTLTFCILILAALALVFLNNCLTQRSDTYIMTNTSQHYSLRITAWNSRGFTVAKPYLSDLLDQTDILALSEHKLYEHELSRLDGVSTDFISFGKSNNGLKISNYGRVPGHCGVAVLWRKSISSYVKPLKAVGNDRICAIQLKLPQKESLCVISVYLPQTASRIADYQQNLDFLESIVTEFLLEGKVIIVGDWNAHIGKESAIRGIGRTTDNGKKVLNFVERCSLRLIDLEEECKGPRYTFCGENGGMSYIDHCAVSSGFREVSSCEVIPNSARNSSDHLPLKIDILVSGCIPNYKLEQSEYILWHKIDTDTIDQIYTQPLERAIDSSGLTTQDSDQWTEEHVDESIETLIELLQHHSSKLPHNKTAGHTKPYWTRDLSRLARAKKKAWKEWVANGRPRDDQNTLWTTYKNSKRTFRQEQRRAQLRNETDFLRNLEKASEID